MGQAMLDSCCHLWLMQYLAVATNTGHVHATLYDVHPKTCQTWAELLSRILVSFCPIASNISPHSCCSGPFAALLGSGQKTSESRKLLMQLSLGKILYSGMICVISTRNPFSTDQSETHVSPLTCDCVLSFVGVMLTSPFRAPKRMQPTSTSGHTYVWHDVLCVLGPRSRCPP